MTDIISQNSIHPRIRTNDHCSSKCRTGRINTVSRVIRVCEFRSCRASCTPPPFSHPLLVPFLSSPHFPHSPPTLTSPFPVLPSPVPFSSSPHLSHSPPLLTSPFPLHPLLLSFPSSPHLSLSPPLLTAPFPLFSQERQRTGGGMRTRTYIYKLQRKSHAQIHSESER